MVKEVWKDVPCYDGYYMASTLGRVKSLGNGKTHKTERILKPGYTGKEKLYRFVVLSKNGVKTKKRVCRLIFETFNGPIPEGMQVNHINEDKTDDRLENLNLMTCKENNNWGTRTERATASNLNHPNKSKWVIQLSMNNEILHFYPSTMQAERETGIKRNCISRCCRHLYGFKSAGGFKWCYAS